jgi:hypothetical protein
MKCLLAVLRAGRPQIGGHHPQGLPVTEHVLRQVFSPFGDLEQVQVLGYPHS